MYLYLYKTNRHFYAQLVDPMSGYVTTYASTLEAIFKKKYKSEYNKYNNCFIIQKLAVLFSHRLYSIGITKISVHGLKYKRSQKIRIFINTLLDCNIKFI